MLEPDLPIIEPAFCAHQTTKQQSVINNQNITQLQDCTLPFAVVHQAQSEWKYIQKNKWSAMYVRLGDSTITSETGDRKVPDRLRVKALPGNNLGQVVHTRASVHQAV